MLEAGGLELDVASRQVRLNGTLLALTATEFRLLEFLMSRPGVVFSREQLLNAVWGQDRAITDRAVDVYVLRLRQKIERDPASPELIHSVRGFGYTFEPRRALLARGRQRGIRVAATTFSATGCRRTSGTAPNRRR